MRALELIVYQQANLEPVWGVIITSGSAKASFVRPSEEESFKAPYRIGVFTAFAISRPAELESLFSSKGDSKAYSEVSSHLCMGMN